MPIIVTFELEHMELDPPNPCVVWRPDFMVFPDRAAAEPVLRVLRKKLAGTRVRNVRVFEGAEVTEAVLAKGPAENSTSHP